MTTSAPPRRHRTKRGRVEPRHLILPEGIASSGWPSVRDTSAKIGIHYDEWQQDFNRALLAKTAEGLYAADTAVMSICRQSGKTFDVGGVVFADSIIHPNTTSVWTAHRFKVSRESFNEMRAWARRPELTPHIEYDDITTAAGNECIPFRNGSRILFAARERGAIRGFTKVRRLILDEAQILTEAAMSDLVPTTNQAENPQIVLMGTPPKPTDPGEVFTALRKAALAGEMAGVLYIEFSAEGDCDIDDWDAVAQANPSFPMRTQKPAILRLRKLLTNEDDYRREGLGIWAPDLQSKHVIDPDDWAARNLPGKPSGPLAFAVDVDEVDGRVFSSIAVSDGLHVEVIEHRPRTGWVVERLAELIERWKPVVVVVDTRGPVAALSTDLFVADIEVYKPNGTEYVQACTGFAEGVVEGKVRHQGQAPLDLAVHSAASRPYGDAWAWSRRQSPADISPLVAVTLAHYAVHRAEEDGPSAYEEQGLVTM